MSLQVLTYIAVGLSFGLYIGIAVWARAGSTKEFYVAGGDVHPVLNGMATGADWMSAASFISMAGLIANMGYGGALFLMGWTGGYVLLAMLLAPYLRKFGKFTVPDFFKARFDYGDSKTHGNSGNSATLLAIICLLLASTTYIIGQMTGVGVAFSRFLGVSNDTGIFIGMAIVFAYAVFGGMKGITYTQVAQYVVLIFAYTIPAVFISFQLTGMPIPQLGLGSNIGNTGTSVLETVNLIIQDLGFGQYTTQVPGTKFHMFVYTLSLMFGTAGLPHVIIRFFTVPDVKGARASAGWALVFIAVLYTTAPAVASMARLNLHATVNKGFGITKNHAEQRYDFTARTDVFAEKNALKYSERPQWMKNWEVTGLLKFTDKNGDGRIQYYNDKSKNADFNAKAAAAGWKGSELKVNRDIIVLANPEIAQLPNWVIALVAAGGLAAALSTAAGLLLAISAAISHDLLKNMFMTDMDEKKELMMGRIAMSFAIVGAGLLGLYPPDFAAGTVAIAFGLAAASIFPALMMGIFSKSMNKTGAVAGMSAGISVTMFYVFAQKGIFFIPGTAFWPELPGMVGISVNAFGAIGAFVNFAVAFATKGMGEPVPADVVAMIEEVRLPGNAGAATH